MKHFFSFPLRRRRLATGLLLLLGWLAGPAARAQAPAWQMAMQMGMNVQAVTTDASGNVYLTGQFYGTITFDSFILTSTNNQYGFIAKWVPATNSFAWAQQMGGTATAVAVSGSNVYLAGSFGGAAVFGGTVLNTAGYTDGFVAKLTDSGSSAAFSWAQRVSGSNYEEIRALAVNGTSVYIAGYFASGAVALGSLTLVNNSTTGNAPRDAFVAKLTDDGATAHFVWALKGGGPDFDEASGLAVVGANVYVTGYCRSSTSGFGSIQLTSAGAADAFVAKISDAGASAAYTWAVMAGGAAHDEATALAVNGASLYAVGRFYSNSASFGPNVLTKSTTYSGDHDLFVTKLTDNGATGSFIWAQRAGDIGGDIGDAVAVSGSNVYVTGRFTGVAVQFGPTTLNASPNAGYWNIFVCKLTDAGLTGAFDWAQKAGGYYDNYGNAVAVSGLTIYVGGNTERTGTFGSFTVSNPTGFTGYLASLTDPTLLGTPAGQGALPFTLSPNPARASATVQLPAVPGAPTATLTLLDALGRTLRTEAVPLPAAGLRHALDLGGLAPGLYAVRVQAGAATATRRLVVE